MIRAAGATVGLMTGPLGAAEEAGGLKALLDRPRLKTEVPIEEIASALSARVPTLMSEHNVAGVGMALIREGSLAWTGSFGVKSTATGEAVDDETIFEAASLTKPVFATGVMKLIESGTIDPDRPLGEYLDKPYIEETDQHPRLARLTARHVLSHTAGLPNWRRGDSLKFILDPGKRWGYSGEGFVYLQRVVEHLTAQPMADFLAAEVIGPIGLELTAAKRTERHEGHIAQGHTTEGKPIAIREWTEDNAASSLQTTAGEYARFMATFLKPTRDEEILIKRSTATKMLSPQVEIKQRAVRGKIAWGLGWGLQRSPERGDVEDAFWHWGNNPGFKSFCIGYPELGIGAAIFTNADFGWKVNRASVQDALGGEQTALGWKS